MFFLSNKIWVRIFLGHPVIKTDNAIIKVEQACNQWGAGGAKLPLQNFSPPGKMMLGIV